MPICTIHGHTCSGVALMVIALVGAKRGLAMNSSPSKRRVASLSVAPQRRCQRQYVRYATAAPLATPTRQSVVAFDIKLRPRTGLVIPRRLKSRPPSVLSAEGATDAFAVRSVHRRIGTVVVIGHQSDRLDDSVDPAVHAHAGINRPLGYSRRPATGYQFGVLRNRATAKPFCSCSDDEVLEGAAERQVELPVHRAVGNRVRVRSANRSIRSELATKRHGRFAGQLLRSKQLKG